MLFRTLVFSVVPCLSQIISLEENVIDCQEIDCSDSIQTQSYTYDSKILGDLTNRYFTLQFFIRINSQIQDSFIAQVQADSYYLYISYRSQQIYIQNQISMNSYYLITKLKTDNWLAIYLTKQYVIIQDYNSQLIIQYKEFDFNSNTKFTLFNNVSSYWQGQGCCIFMYLGVDYMANYQHIIYNNKKPEAKLIINIQQEDVLQYTLFDHSDYQYIVRMGQQLASDQYDPTIHKDYLQFSSNQFIYANDVQLNQQYSIEFRLAVSTLFTSNIILLNYSQPDFNILIYLDGTQLNFKQNDIIQEFKLLSSPFYHFCIAVIQNLEESVNQYNINFYQFSDSGISSNILNVTKSSQYKIQSQVYGIIQLGSQENQFSANEYFQLYHFRLYDGFFLDDTSSIDPNCSIYLNDRCIICKSGLVLSNNYKCIASCNTISVLTKFTQSHNQCVRLCKAKCATCSMNSPYSCLICYGIRVFPPTCSCPIGYFEDYVSPNCRKYLPDQSTQNGIYSTQCNGIGQSEKIIEFSYKYKIAPQVALFLIGASQTIFDQEVNLQLGEVTISNFQIIMKCSFQGQFYNIQWMSSLSNHLLYKEYDQYSTITIQRDSTNQDFHTYFQLQGWAQTTQDKNFNINVIETTDSFTIQSANKLQFIKYSVIQTDFLSYFFNYNQAQNKSILFQLDQIPKSFQLAQIIQGLEKQENQGSYNLMKGNRNSSIFQFKVNQKVDQIQGFLLFAGNQCNPKEYCNFYDSYIKSCNLNYTLCTCNEISYYVNSTNQCDKCDNNCYLCDGMSTNCTKCSSNHYLKQSQFSTSYQNNYCDKCDDNCQQCERQSTYCTQCKQNQFLVKNICMSCHLSCLTCSNPTISDCLTCEKNAMKQKNNTCLCKEGFYYESFCQNCHPNCLTCTQGTDTSCTKCSPGKIINQQNYCECSDGQYLNMSDYQCYQCDSQCLTCIDLMICTSCTDDKYLQGTSCLCKYTNYLDDQGVCQQCQFPCENCLSPGNKCLSCPLNRYLDNQFCICNQGYYEKDGQCQGCMSICLECINESSCTKCQGNRALDQCKCQDGYYEYDNDCTKCPLQCLTCDNLQQCTSCKNTMELVNNLCKCIKGTYYEGGNCLSCNTQLGLLQPICNIINCGDGIQSINEECDDGNTIKNDGCSDCKIDAGYQCQQKLLQTSFCYKCQGYCTKCAYINSQINCLQCNLGYYLQNNSCHKCNQYCLQCTSQTVCTQCTIMKTSPDQNGKCPECEEGQQLLNGICQSVCGDGILSTEEDCDFGQQNGSGGCSLYCTEQQGFRCFQNICNKIIEQQIAVQYVNSTTKTQIAMLYEFKASDEFCNSFQIEIDNFTIEEFSVNFTIQNDQCNFLFDYKKTIIEQNLIRIKIPLNISRLLFTETRELIVKPRKQIYYTEDQVQQAQSIKNTQDQLTFLFYFMGPIIAIFGGFQFFLSILDILSWINNLYFINIQFPLNVQLIFQNTIWDNIQLFPSSFIPRFNTPSDPYYRESPVHFMERNIDPLFINNAYQTFALWGLFFSTYFMAKLIITILSTKSRKSNRKITFTQVGTQNQFIEFIKQEQVIVKKQSKFLENILKTSQHFSDNVFSYFLKLLNLSYLDLFSAITLQLYCFDQIYKIFSIVLINNVVAYLCILLCLYLLYLTWYVCNQNIILLQNKRFLRLYGTIYEYININIQEAALYAFINQIRKTAFIFTVVYFYNKPTLQTSLCCFISFINVGFILFQNPFNTTKNLIQFGFPDLCIFLLMAVFTICAIDDQVSAFSDITRFNIGWLIITIILISILVQIYFIFELICQNIKNRIKYLKLKIKKICI